MTPPSILVIGANGFIGRQVVAHWVAQGGVVRAGVRTLGNRAHAESGAHYVACDAYDTDSLRHAMEGVATAILCARDDATPGAALRATQATLTAAAAAGVPRVILVSSVAAYGTVFGDVHEATPAQEPSSPYGREKLELERFAAEFSRKGVSVAAVRPTLVYGPGGEEWTARFIRAIVAGRMVDLGPNGEGDANLIHVRDLASLIALLAARVSEGFEVYNANGDEIPTFNAYFAALNSEMGRPPLRPHMLAPGLQAAQRNARKILRKLTAPIPGLNAAFAFDFGDEPPETYAAKRRFIIDRARAIGYQPGVKLAEGIRESVAWARDVGLVT